MSRIFQTLLTVGVLLTLAPLVSAQVSPRKDATATIAGQEVKIDYFAPSMRGRKIYGGLVRYGDVWCPGANWATTITSPVAFTIGSLKLAAGSYALWVIPNANDFELIVNSDAKAFHLNHKSETDLGRMRMNLKTLDKPVEQLTFEIRPDTGATATVALVWENTEASVPIIIGQ